MTAGILFLSILCDDEEVDNGNDVQEMKHTANTPKIIAFV